MPTGPAPSTCNTSRSTAERLRQVRPRRRTAICSFRNTWSAAIEVKQPVPEGKPQPAERPGDTRPSAGEKTTFVEEITAAKLTPVFTAMPVAPRSGCGWRARAALPTAAASAVPALPGIPTRIYTIRGVTRSGRPGSTAARVTIPLVDPPAAADRARRLQAKETGLSLAWTAPPAPAAETKVTPVKFNVYADGAKAPVNPAPLDAPAFERAGVEFGKEECFVVRSVVTVLGGLGRERAVGARVRDRRRHLSSGSAEGSPGRCVDGRDQPDLGRRTRRRISRDMWCCAARRRVTNFRRSRLHPSETRPSVMRRRSRGSAMSTPSSRSIARRRRT